MIFKIETKSTNHKGNMSTNILKILMASISKLEMWSWISLALRYWYSLLNDKSNDLKRFSLNLKFAMIQVLEIEK